MNATTTFILADNQDITLAGLRALVAQEFPQCRLIEKHCKKELLQALHETESCVIVIDYTLFYFNGVEDFLNVIARFDSAHWVVFSSELSDGLLRRLSIEKNVNIILKDNSAEEITTCLRKAARHEHYLCWEISAHLKTSRKAEKAMPVTASETEILRLIARGMSVKEIAAARNSSTHTVTTHKKNIFRKIEVNSVYEAVKYALRCGLVDPADYYI